MKTGSANVRRRAVLAAAVAAVGLGQFPLAALGAGVNGYQGPGGTAAAPTTGNFSTGPWFGTAPTAGGSPTLELDFSNSGANTYVATDDLAGALQLNILQFGTDSTSGGTSATVAAGAGNTFSFVSNGATTPTVIQNGTSAFTVSVPTTATNSLTLGKTGAVTNTTAGAVTFSGTVTNTGGLAVTGGNYTMSGVVSGAGAIAVSGGGSLSFTNTANTYTVSSVTVDGAGSNLTLQSGGSFGQQPGAVAAGNPPNRTLTLTNGGQLTINTSWDLNLANGNFPIISIGAGGGVFNQAAGAVLLLNDASEFVGAAGAPLLKTGAGTLQLNSQTYTFTGAITVNQGTIQVDGANTLGTATAVIVNPASSGIVGTAGAVLNVDNGITFARPIQITGTGISSGGALINGTSGNTATLTGGITLIGNASMGGAGNLTVSTVGIGDGGGNFALTKVGAGIVILNAADTYTGGTFVTAGTLRAAAGTGLPSAGNLNINGGVFEPTVNYSANLGTGSGQVQLPGGTSGFSAGGPAISVNLNGGATVQWGSATFNPASLVLNQTTAAGTLDFLNPIDLNGAVRSFTNNSTSVNNLSTVAAPVTNSSGTAAGININGPTGGAGIIQFTNAGNTGIGSVTLTGGELGILSDANIGGASTPINFNGGGLQILGTALTGFGTHTVTFTANKNIQLDINNAGNTFTVPSGAGTTLTAGQTLTKVGPGKLVLTAASNTVTTLNMNGGTLDIGTGTLNISNLGGTTIRGTANSILNATGGGRIVLSTAGGTNFADNSVASGVTLVINAKVSGVDATTGFEYCCDAPGGIIVLANSANDFQGDVFINSAGTIQTPSIGLKNSAAGNLGRGTTINFNATGGRILYTGAGETTDRILNLSGTTTGGTLEQAGTGLLKVTGNLTATGAGIKTFTLQGSTAGVGELAGVISNSTAATNIAKAGTGTWVLSGANTFTGTLAVQAGALQLAANAGNTTAGVSSAAGANASARLSLANGTMLQLRSDTNVTFAGTDGIGALNNAAVGIDVNQLTGAGSNNVFTISPGITPIGNAVTLNVTGGNGDSLAFGTLQYITGATNVATLNPTTANMSLVGFNNTYATAVTVGSTLVLGGTSANNTVTGVIANQAAGSLGTGTTALTKSGTSTWSLAGANTYTGATSVGGGLLRVNGSLAAGTATTVTPGGSLGGTGTINGAVTASATGGNIDLRDGAVGTLTLSSTLTLAGAAATPNNLYFDLGNGAAVTDKVVASGVVSVTNTGGAVIFLNQLPGAPINAGTYTLISGAAGSAGNAPYVLGTTAVGGNTFSLQSSGGGPVLEQLVVTTATAGPAAAFWSGATDVNWTTAGNWNTDATSGTPAGAVPGVGSNVTFHTTTPAAANLATTLGADFEINSLRFAAGTSAVTIAGSNTLTIDAGTANGNPAGSGISNLAEGVTHTISAKVGLGATQTWTVGPASGASTANLVVSGAVNDFGGTYGLTKAGTGSLTLGGMLSYGGPTNVSAGTLRLTNVAGGGSANTQTGTTAVQAGATLRVSALGNGTATNGPTALPNSALSTSAVTLNGGTLQLDPVAGGTSGSFNTRFVTTPNQNNLIYQYDFLAAVLAGSPTTMTGQGTVAGYTNVPAIGLSYNADAGTRAFYTGQASTNSFMFRATGSFTVVNAGTYAFQTGSDDATRLYIDNKLVVLNDGGHGVQTLTGASVNLSAGLHEFRFDFDQGGGGDTAIASYAGTFANSDTGAAANTFAVLGSVGTAPTQTLDNIAMGNNVTLTASSTIDTGTNANFTQVGLGSLTFGQGTGNAATLTATGLTGKSIHFAGGLTLQSGSTSTIDNTNGPDVFLDGQALLSAGGTATLVKAGNGQLFLTNTSNGTPSVLNGATINVQAGRLVAQGSSSANTGTANPLAGASIQLSGGTLVLDSKAGPSGGAAASGATFDNPVSVTSSSTIEVQPIALNLTLGGAASGNGISLTTGATLTVNPLATDGQGTVGALLTVPGPVTGAGSITVNSTGLGATNFPGTLILNGTNNYTGGTTVTSGTLQGNTNGLQGVITNNAASNNSTAAPGGVVFDQTFVGTFAGSISGTGQLTVQNTGTVIAPGANLTYSGPTNLNNGVLALSSSTGALAGALNFGINNAVTSVGTLDLSAANATFGSMVVQTNTGNANLIRVGAAQTLTINGNVTIGSGQGANTTTVLNTAGGGSLVVNNAAANGIFTVGGTSGTTAVGNIATANLSGLGSLTISLNTTSGVVTVNPNITTGTTNVNGLFSTLILPSTGAGNTTITASRLDVGVGPTYNSVATQVNAVKLGTGTTTINVDTVNIGNTGTAGRDFGAVTFNTGSGSLKIRAANTTGAAAFNLGTGTSATGTGNTTPVTTNTFDVSGHSADLLFGAANIGTQTRVASYANVFSFDKGTLTMTSLTAGTRSGAALTAAMTDTVTVNLGSAASTAADTVAITNGILALGTSNPTAAAFNATVNSTLNIGGGTVNIGATGGNAVVMATATGATSPNINAATALLSITGGTASLTGNIAKGSAASGTGFTAAATLTLNGGTLNLNNNSIGTAALPIDTLNFQSGTLMNVAAINGTGGLTKITSGQAGGGVLTLSGAVAYSGATQVNAGTLLANGTVANTASVTVASAATLGGSGTIAGPVSILAGGNLAPGNSPGQLTLTGNAGNTSPILTMTSTSNLLMELTATATPGSGYDQVVVNGTTGATAVNLGGANLNLSGATNAAATYVLIDNQTASATANQFASLPEGSTVTVGGNSFVLTYAFNNGGANPAANDVALSPVPEPASVGLLAVGAIGLLARRRRRQADRLG